MTISLYAASVPVFKQMLKGMSGILTKAEAHASENKIDHNAYLQARLFPDMFALVKQVQIACEFARGGSARLAGLDAPVVESKEATFAELQTLLAQTASYLDGLKPAQIDGAEAREITLRPGTPKERKFQGQAYLLAYVLPQFFFHVTTVYAILRHNGLAVGKQDYMGM